MLGRTEKLVRLIPNVLLLSEVGMLEKSLDNVKYFTGNKDNQFENFYKKIIIKIAMYYKYYIFITLLLIGKEIVE